MTSHRTHAAFQPARFRPEQERFADFLCGQGIDPEVYIDLRPRQARSIDRAFWAQDEGPAVGFWDWLRRQTGDPLAEVQHKLFHGPRERADSEAEFKRALHPAEDPRFGQKPDISGAALTIPKRAQAA
jgi:hypothetical protein